MPSIGYGSNKKTRHMMPDGFKKFVVHNVKVCVLINLIYHFLQLLTIIWNHVFLLHVCFYESAKQLHGLVKSVVFG